jgi:hypothetical protein
VRWNNVNEFIHIRSRKFPILPGEKEELVNEGMYGKALAQYLQSKLTERGYAAPFIACEDWGWWVELKTAPFTFGVCIYCGPDVKEPLNLFCTDGAAAPRKWSWRRFRFVETKPWSEKLHGDLVSIFRADPEIEIVSTRLDSPFPENGNSESGGAANTASPHR